MKKLLTTLLLALAIAVQAQTAKVKVTYYTLKGTTALGIQTRQGICAVSPDLEKKGFRLGEYVHVQGYGTYLIADRTNKKVKNTVDIWRPRRGKARHGRLTRSGTAGNGGRNVKITLIYDND